MLFVFHINKIYNRKPSHIPQPKLSRNLLSGLDISLERRGFYILPDPTTAGVYVYGYQCLCRIYHNRAAGFQRYSTLINRLDLFFYLVLGKDGPFLLVEFDPPLMPRRNDLHISLHFGKGFLVVHKHFSDLTVKIIPQSPQTDILLLVYQGKR